MNCFQLIRTVLDEAYEEIPGNTAERDAAICVECKQLSEKYRKLRHAGCLDYRDPARRFAYLFKYTTSHANIVCQRIASSKPLQDLFDRGDVVVSCVGGGPGSDLLGILKYCDTWNKTPDVTCFLLDRDPTWGESWCDVGNKVGAKMTLRTTFQEFDVTDSTKWRRYKKHLGADLFTLIFFMSEVYALRDEAEEYFDTLFSSMKPESLMLYVDNNAPEFYGWFDELVVKHGLTLVDSGSGTAQMPYDEEKNDLGEYAKAGRFESPKLKSDIAWRIVRK